MPSRLASSLSFGAAFSLGMAIAAITCGNQAVMPGLGTGASGSFCAYPRGCYIIPKDSTECDDCSGGPDHCRLYFVPTPGQPNPLDLGGFFVPAGADLAGSGLVQPDKGPLITDQPVLCTLYLQETTLPEGKQVLCAEPDSLCVARGTTCAATSYCVRVGQTCAAGVPYTPQHKPGMNGTDTYCPYTDDVCCAPAAMPDLAGVGDAGGSDASPPADAAVADATTD